MARRKMYRLKLESFSGLKYEALQLGYSVKDAIRAGVQSTEKLLTIEPVKRRKRK